MDIDLLNNILNDILGCSCNSLENGICADGDTNSCKCPCRHYITHGSPSWDTCCDEGQLTINVDRIYQTETFPTQTNKPSTCSRELAADVTVTLLRCYPANLKDDGSPPTPAEQQAAAESLNRDSLLLTKATICCLQQQGKNRPFIFQGARPLGPQGGCAGVEIKFTVALY